MSIYVFDLDNTLCTTVKNKQGHNAYDLAEPFKERIKKVNELYDDGHIIKIETARGISSGINWTKFTEGQLERWGLKHHSLRVGVKPNGDYFIDDKAISDKEFFK